MKKKLGLFLLFTLIIITAFSFFSKNDFLGVRGFYYVSPCSKPIAYRIGTIDERFGLNKSQVLSAAGQAADIWNTALGRKIYAYDPQARLSINMVYDRRQSLNTQINSLEDELNSEKASLQTEFDRYKKMSADFKTRVSDFNKKLEYWNSLGGAPQEEYDKLIAEQKSLNDEAQSLNAIAKKLNLSTDQYNNQVQELNKTVKSLNNTLDVNPEEGIYDPANEKIDIFLINDRSELIRTLAHELGHARGLGHSNNPNAIMYPKTTKSLKPADNDIQLLNEVCRKRPFYELLVWDLSEVLSRYKTVSNP